MASLLYGTIAVVLFLVGLVLAFRINSWLESGFETIIGLMVVLFLLDQSITWLFENALLGDLFGLLFNGMFFYLAFVDKKYQTGRSVLFKIFAGSSLILQFVAFFSSSGII